MLGKTGQEEKGVTEDEIVGWHHGFNGYESEQILGDSKGQGSLACCSPDVTEWATTNNNNDKYNTGVKKEKWEPFQILKVYLFSFLLVDFIDQFMKKNFIMCNFPVQMHISSSIEVNRFCLWQYLQFFYTLKSNFYICCFSWSLHKFYEILSFPLFYRWGNWDRVWVTYKVHIANKHELRQMKPIDGSN